MQREEPCLLLKRAIEHCRQDAWPILIFHDET